VRLRTGLWVILVTVVTMGLLASGCTDATSGSGSPAAPPAPERTAVPEWPQFGAPPEPQFTTHIVQRGENLTRIAIQYGTRVGAIQDLNDMDDTEIYPGDTLRVPASTYQEIYKDAVDRHVAAVATWAAEASALLAEEMDSRRELAEAEWERLGTRSERWMIVAIVVLSVTTLVASGVFFYRYRPTGPHMTPPEELGGHIQSLGDNAAKLELDVGDRLHRLYERTEQLVELGFRHSEQVGSLAETFMTLQKAIDVRDDENKKLKLGYDAQIFGRFLRRFIRVDRAIQDYLDDPSGETENLLLVKRLLEDALDECGVEPFEPEVGEDYRAMGDQVADNPKDIPTTDPDQDFQVAEIVERGYRLRGADDSWQIVVPAKVRIYKYQH